MKARHAFPASARWSHPGHVIISGELHKTEIQKRREFEYFGIVFITAGEGWFEDKHTPRTVVSRGDMFFLYPNVWHTYGPEEGGYWNEIFLVFYGEIPGSWHRAGWLPTNPPLLSLGDVSFWKRKIENVPGKRMPWDAGSCCEEMNRLQQLLSESISHHKGGGSAQESCRQWMETVNKLLEKELPAHPDWDSIAARLGMGYEAFRKRFVRVFNVSPVKHLIRLRINRSCDMLAHPAHSNRMVAEALGFCDEYYFSRCFKQVIGMTPREFRRQMWRIE